MNEQQKEALEKADFKCAKCGYYSPIGKDLILNKKSVLCGVCNTFAPINPESLSSYIGESIDWQVLESFRKHAPESNLKKGMAASAESGKAVSRPPFGYRMINGELIPAENSDEVREIFESFSGGTSLNSIARGHNMSVNGIKKILKNFTYIGKIKFDSKISQGNHQPIISKELFNEVQKTFEQKG